MRTPSSTELDRIAARCAAKPKVSAFGAAIEQPSTGFTWEYGESKRPYFIASITKLYTVAMIMQLRDERALTLDTRAAEILGVDTMRGLNVHDGHDYGPAVTVRELLSQTSGIPDYYDQKRPDGTTFADDMIRADAAWSFDDFLDMARSLPSRFTPSEPGRAQYCDTNYQLLGRVIEVATAGSFADALRRRVLEPLGLQHTWLFTPQTLDRYDEVAPLRHGRIPLRIPKTIASFPPDGAVVSTATDQLRFLRAFITGELFPAQYLTEMTAQWNSVFSPLVPIHYGVGLMRYRQPRWQTPFAPAPAMIGHSGAFGTVLYYVPDRDLYLAATVNQMRAVSLPHILLLRLAYRFRRQTVRTSA
ncbi:beta-lactamase family protein [Nocardia uniformis]|uniref:Beta-lactamase family protein n=1 Tax=Nocardia uniformis TaxID=53432 RepID=A0A849BY83_9NOCA|nr:serine hydrolase domain-containing protein [Nocardia uniformis]NNH69230.1 beta-lactamase family protein [Nocardia uniformis]